MSKKSKDSDKSGGELKCPKTFIQKSPAVRICIELSEYKGLDYVNIREWVKRGDDADYRPTPRGMTVGLGNWDAFQSMIENFSINKDRKKDKDKKKIEKKVDKDNAKSINKKLNGDFFVVFNESKELEDVLRTGQHRINKGLLMEKESLKKLRPERKANVWKLKVQKGVVVKASHYLSAKKDGDEYKWLKK